MHSCFFVLTDSAHIFKSILERTAELNIKIKQNLIECLLVEIKCDRGASV